jgi:hypothetical protein
MRALLLALVLLAGGCATEKATEKKIDRAADGIAEVAATVQRAVNRFAPPAPAIATPPARATSPLDAVLAAVPTIAVNTIALWRAVSAAWDAAKAAHRAATTP